MPRGQVGTRDRGREEERRGGDMGIGGWGRVGRGDMVGRGVRAARGVTDGGLSGERGGVTEGRGGGEGCGGREGVSRRLRAVAARRGCCGRGVTSCRPSRAPRPALSESRLRSLSRSALLAEVASAEMSLHAIYLHQVCHLRFPGSPCPQHPQDTGPLGSPGVPWCPHVHQSVTVWVLCLTPWKSCLAMVPCPSSLVPSPIPGCPTLPAPPGDTHSQFLAAAGWGVGDGALQLGSPMFPLLPPL